MQKHTLDPEFAQFVGRKELQGFRRQAQPGRKKREQEEEEEEVHKLECMMIEADKRHLGCKMVAEVDRRAQNCRIVDGVCMAQDYRLREERDCKVRRPAQERRIVEHMKTVGYMTVGQSRWAVVGIPK